MFCLQYSDTEILTNVVWTLLFSNSVLLMCLKYCWISGKQCIPCTVNERKKKKKRSVPYIGNITQLSHAFVVWLGLSRYIAMKTNARLRTERDMVSKYFGWFLRWLYWFCTILDGPGTTQEKGRMSCVTQISHPFAGWPGPFLRHMRRAKSTISPFWVDLWLRVSHMHWAHFTAFHVVYSHDPLSYDPLSYNRTRLDVRIT